MMLVRVYAVMLLLFGTLAGLAAGARLVGQSEPHAPTFLDSGDCDPPCWQGIRPGTSTTFEFFERVKNTGLYTGHATDYGDDVTVRFELYTFGVLTLADVLREYGVPDRVGCLGLDHTDMYPGEKFATMVRLYFAEGLIEVNAIGPGRTLRVLPDMQIRSIRYFAPGEPAYPIGETTAWHGFASTRVYLACAASF